MGGAHRQSHWNALCKVAQILLLKNVCKDLPSEVLQERSMRTGETLVAGKKIAKGAEKRAG